LSVVKVHSKLDIDIAQYYNLVLRWTDVVEKSRAEESV
jgi:hypothetical protein